jgi:hypothetical protein
MVRTSLVAAVVLAGLAACDPVDTITVRFPVEPDTTARVWWVLDYHDRAYAHTTVFDGTVTGTELVASRTECCGTAAAYRDRALYFLACTTTGGGPPTLVCGRPGAAPTTFVHHVMPQPSCAAIEHDLGLADLDLATCTPRPSR